MTIIRVDMGAGGWAAVPRATFDDARLSLRARGLLAWFLTRGDGFEVNALACRLHHGLGEEAWGRVVGELAIAGYYHRQKTRDAKGRVRTGITVTANVVSGGA